MCPTCGFANPAGMRFCGQCGGALAMTCPRCAAEMPPKFAFCGSCGTRLDGSAETPGAVGPATAPTASPSVTQITQTSEARQVTVLFADISGFTALAERLDPEELHENMRTAWDAIAADIRAAGGLIEKYIGDAVVAVFGAVEDDADHPERAQRAALAIIAALERTNVRIVERTGRRLALRVGVNTGIAMAGAIGDRESEFGVIGDAVNIAARLEQAAEPGEVLVGDATYRHTPGVFSYEPHPPVIARGKSAPLICWRLISESSVTAVGERRTPLVGRDDVMNTLVSALDDALAGHGKVVAVVGEAGSGKSRIVAELLAHPRTHGARVARVRCSAYDARRSYGAVADLLATILGIPANASVEHAHRTITETLPEIDPETKLLVLRTLGYSTDAPQMSGETRTRLIERGIRDLLFSVARTQGLVTAIEGLQWIDPASMQLLATVASTVGDARALFVVSYRPDMITSWLGARSHMTVELAPLPREALATLIDQLEGSLPTPLVAEISARAAGNPAYVEEALQWLTTSGAVVGRDGGSALVDLSRAPQLPDTFQQLLLRRLEVATPTERRVLQAAAVIGDGFETATLRSVFGAEVDVETTVSTLLERRFIESEPRGGYRFRPTLLREVLYIATLARHREELHGRVGLALESAQGQHPEVLAQHFAASTHTLRALDHAFRAGDRALSLHDGHDALHHYRSAASLALRLPDGGVGERARALLAVCDAATMLGREGDALAAAEEALAIGLPETDIRAALRRRAGRLAARAKETHRAAEHLADADRLTTLLGPERSELTLAKAWLAQSDDRAQEALGLARQAASEARAMNDRTGELAATEAAVTFAESAGASEERRRALERTVALCTDLGDLAALARSLGALLHATLDRGETLQGQNMARDLLSTESRLGTGVGRAASLRAVSRARFLEGNWDEAERLLADAMAVSDMLGADPKADPAATQLMLATLAVERGDLPAARSRLEGAAQVAERSEEGDHHVTRLLALKARIALDLAQQDEARRHAAASLARQREHQCRRCAASIMPTLVTVAASDNAFEEAESYRTLGLEQAARLALPLSVADMRLAGGLLFAAQGDATRARRELEAVIEAADRFGTPYLAAKANAALAQAELEPLARERAIAAYERLGAPLQAEALRSGPKGGGAAMSA